MCEKYGSSLDRKAPARGTWSNQLDRFRQLGLLNDDDTAETSEQFLNIALARALPASPRYVGCEIFPVYYFQSDVLTQECDSDRGHDDDVLACHQTWAAVSVGEHAWCPVGKLLPHLERKHPGFGSWLAHALSNPFLTIGPAHYVDWVSSAHWYGESNEEMAREEYEGSMTDEEAAKEENKWRGPTRADFEKLVPGWAQHSTFKKRQHADYLKLARRIFNVDMRPLFDGTKHALDSRRHLMVPPCYRDNYQRPFVFGWTDGDLVLESIDQCFNDAFQANGVCEYCALVPADDLKSCAAELRRIYEVLATYDLLAASFNHYRMVHKIV
jgi:PRTRC genetic system protein F